MFFFSKIIYGEPSLKSKGVFDRNEADWEVTTRGVEGSKREKRG